MNKILVTIFVLSKKGDMNYNDLAKVLKVNGWVEDRQKGSHVIWKKQGHQQISVPNHGKTDIAKGLLNKLLKQAGLK